MICEYLIGMSAPAVRFYRNCVNLYLPEIQKPLPKQALQLDVGCLPDLVTGGIALYAPSYRLASANHYRKIGSQGPSQKQTNGACAD